MADYFGVTQQVYSNWENGRTKKFDSNVLNFVQQNIVEGSSSIIKNKDSHTEKAEKDSHKTVNLNNKLNINNIEQNETLNPKMLSDLIDSNKVLANAMADFAIANKNLSENSVRLTKMAETNSGVQVDTDLIVGSILSKVQELLSVLHSGKGKDYATKTKAIEAMHKILADFDKKNQAVYIDSAKGI